MSLAQVPRTLNVAGLELPVYEFNTVVVGSGAAARKAALSLVRLGIRNIAIVTEGWNSGTSYNAGSDKQTYYKLAVAGESADSPLSLAEDLFAGGCMHGDIALCEAQHSAAAFFNLVELGVPFPHDVYGGFVGYQTDNDSLRRATSAGPLTSKLMCERLGDAIEAEQVKIFDDYQVVSLLTRKGAEEKGDEVCGAVAIDKQNHDNGLYGLSVFNAVNVILATGGPGGMYSASVYPQSQFGGIGIALTAGAVAHNLTESQYGIASLGFRWNLSGSYQQVLPRYVSTTPDGNDEREFLNDFFPDLKTLTHAIFHKGYEWPFDSERIDNLGSSIIDLLVYKETVEKNRRVFLDFTANPTDPSGAAFELNRLEPEVIAYLENSGATQNTPIARLLSMNPLAVEQYRDHGISLESERLEIAVCAQHNNGGLKANVWWESNVKHLFPIGEVCGTHGVRRPGGSALNAGQVGAMRAAMFIKHNYDGDPCGIESFGFDVSARLRELVHLCETLSNKSTPGKNQLSPKAVLAEIRDRMTHDAGFMREKSAAKSARDSAWELYRTIRDGLKVSGSKNLAMGLRVIDLCLTHVVYLEAIYEYLKSGGKSRGGFVVLDDSDKAIGSGPADFWRVAPSDPECDAQSKVLEVSFVSPGDVRKNWVAIRPIPKTAGWFERVWTEYRTGQVYSRPEEE